MGGKADRKLYSLVPKGDNGTRREKSDKDGRRAEKFQAQERSGDVRCIVGTTNEKISRSESVVDGATGHTVWYSLFALVSLERPW
jgi:hypothetical protein